MVYDLWLRVEGLGFKGQGLGWGLRVEIRG